MDAGYLLRTARDRAGINQRVLAKRGGTSQAQVARYESGAVSPTTATLDRLLAACGLQVRAQLEPFLADVDARVDALLAGEPEMEVYGLPELIRTLDDHPDASHGGFSSVRPHREGPVPWGVRREHGTGAARARGEGVHHVGHRLGRRSARLVAGHRGIST